MADTLLGGGGEFEPTGGDVLFHQLGKTGFVNRDFAAEEDVNFFGVIIDSGDMMAHLGKAGAAGETDVSGSDDGDIHD
jgi:hypothetical protein